MNNNRPTSFFVLVASLVSALASIFIVSPAWSSEQRSNPAIDWSLDGLSWSSSLQDQVFHSDQLHVPGDAIRGVFWIKNASPYDAILTVQLSTASIAAEAEGSITISTISDGQSTTVPVENCAITLDNVLVKKGQALRIQNELQISQSANLAARKATESLSFTASLHDKDVRPVPGVCLSSIDSNQTGEAESSSGQNRLAVTGTFELPWFALSLGCILLGLWKIRRRKDEAYA